MDKTYAPPAAQEEIPYDGLLPINASEYGGVAYGVNGNGWGYRTGSSEEEFVDGYVKLTELLLRCGNSADSAIRSFTTSNRNRTDYIPLTASRS